MPGTVCAGGAWSTAGGEFRVSSPVSGRSDSLRPAGGAPSRVCESFYGPSGRCGKVGCKAPDVSEGGRESLTLPSLSLSPLSEQVEIRRPRGANNNVITESLQLTLNNCNPNNAIVSYFYIKLLILNFNIKLVAPLTGRSWVLLSQVSLHLYFPMLTLPFTSSTDVLFPVRRLFTRPSLNATIINERTNCRGDAQVEQLTFHQMLAANIGA